MLKREIGDLLKRLLLLAVFIYLIFGKIFGIQPMNGEAMSPSILPGDLMFYYRQDRQYRNGDVLILERDGEIYTGRIAARGGDTVDLTDSGMLSVNGSVVVESRAYGKTLKYENDQTYPLVLDEGTYFLLGDQRERAKDSRYYGAVSPADVKGRVIVLLRRNGL